jgi:hypothetical protein
LKEAKLFEEVPDVKSISEVRNYLLFHKTDTSQKKITGA